MRDYIIYFFIYAFLGWVIEVSYHTVTKGRFINRGFLAGPYCPIYGFGAIAVIFFLTDIGEKSRLILFLGSMFIASLIEFIAGFLLEKIFHERWWDYSNNKLNIGGYICLEFSIIWGVFCFLLYEVAHPMIRKLVGIIPDMALNYIAISLVIVMTLDLIATINTLIGLNKEFKAIEKISKDIKKVSDKIGERVYDKTLQIENRQEELKKTREYIELENRIKELRERRELIKEKRILKSFPNLTNRLEERQRDIEELRDRIRDQYSRD